MHVESCGLCPSVSRQSNNPTDHDVRCVCAHSHFLNFYLINILQYYYAMLFTDDLGGLADDLARLSQRLKDPDSRWHVLHQPDFLPELSNCLIELFSRWCVGLHLPSYTSPSHHPDHTYHTMHACGPPPIFKGWPIRQTPAWRQLRGQGRGSQPHQQWPLGHSAHPSAPLAPEPGGSGAFHRGTGIGRGAADGKGGAPGHEVPSRCSDGRMSSRHARW